MNQNLSVARTPLLSVKLGATRIDHAEIHEIVLQPGQKAGLHLHPCPVVGYIAEGIAVMQIEGQEEQILHKGEAFFEPKDVRISQFGNYSSNESLKFIAFYLLDGDQELIKML